MGFIVSVYADSSGSYVELNSDLRVELVSGGVWLEPDNGKLELIRCRTSSAAHIVNEIERIIRFIECDEFYYLSVYLPKTRLHKFRIVDWEQKYIQ